MDGLALLRAIAEQPAEDTPRLMYADWLEEHGDPTDDRAAATREFIRASCQIGRTSKLMPKAGYAWVMEHWRRLVPSVCALHVPFQPGGEMRSHGHSGTWYDMLPSPPQPPGLVSGRHVGMLIRLENKLYHPGRGGGRPHYTMSMPLTFWKGFCSGYTIWSSWGMPIVRPALLADQPFLVIAAGLTPPKPNLPLLEVL